MKLENQRLCVEISELGAEVTRIYDKKNNAELLWEADPVYWKRHSPVLFPNVGKDVSQYGSDQRDTLSDIPARIRKGQQIQMYL